MICMKIMQQNSTSRAMKDQVIPQNLDNCAHIQLFPPVFAVKEAKKKKKVSLFLSLVSMLKMLESILSL